MCRSVFQMTALVVVASVMGTGTAEARDRSLKMYDLRDLAAVLPASESILSAEGGAGTPTWLASANPGAGMVHVVADPTAITPMGSQRVPFLSDLPLLGTMFVADGQPNSGGHGGMASGKGGGAAGMGAGAVAAPPVMSTTEVLMNQLSAPMSLAVTSLMQNVFLVEAEDADHAKLAAILDQMRSLYEPRVEVEVACFVMSGETAPEIGTQVTRQDAVYRVRTVGPRRSAIPVDAMRSQSYIASWTPIVADSAVGLEPTVAMITDGLSLVIRVGGPGETERVRVQGRVSQAQVESASVAPEQAVSAKATAGPMSGKLDIGLPHVTARSVISDVDVAPRVPTVFTTVPGFDTDQQLVFTISIKTVKSAAGR